MQVRRARVNRERSEPATGGGPAGSQDSLDPGVVLDAIFADVLEGARSMEGVPDIIRKNP